MCHLAETFLNYSLGNGENTLFFLDPWLNHQPLMLRVGDRLQQDLACDTACKASHFICDRRWTLPPATTIEMHDLWLDILRTPINGDRDDITWVLHDKGFSLHSAWDAIHEHGPRLPWARFIWSWGTSPRKAFCPWQALSQGLPTHDNLQRRGLTIISRCVMCRCDLEALNHLLSSCGFSSSIWRSTLFGYPLLHSSHGTL